MKEIYDDYQMSMFHSKAGVALCLKPTQECREDIYVSVDSLLLVGYGDNRLKQYSDTDALRQNKMLFWTMGILQRRIFYVSHTSQFFPQFTSLDGSRFYQAVACGLGQSNLIGDYILTVRSYGTTAKANAKY